MRDALHRRRQPIVNSISATETNSAGIYIYNYMAIVTMIIAYPIRL
jgi:hypothetical protein